VPANHIAIITAALSCPLDARPPAMLPRRIIRHIPNVRPHDRGNRAFLFGRGIRGKSREKIEDRRAVWHASAGAAPRFAITPAWAFPLPMSA